MYKKSKIICIVLSIFLIICTSIVLYLQAKGVPNEMIYAINDEGESIIPEEVNMISEYGGYSHHTYYKRSDFKLKSLARDILYIMPLITFAVFIIFLIVSKKNKDDSEKANLYKPYLMLFLISFFTQIITIWLGGFS